MNKLFAVVFAVLAWYGHYHGWGFWVFALVFLSGCAFVISDAETKRALKELEDAPDPTAVLRRNRPKS